MRHESRVQDISVNTSSLTAVDQVEPSHPAFCEGGIACERTQPTPADWSHEGRETKWHTGDHQLALTLIRDDGQGRAGYDRVEVRVQLRLTDEAFVDREVDISLDGQSLDRLIETLCEYREERDKWSGHVYDLPTSDLPRTGGMTKAQHVWNAITLGAEAERAGLVAKAV